MALILKLPVGATNGENSGSGSSGGSTTPSTASLNVFCQLEEPEIKEGIWIQSDKGYENVVVDSAIYKVGGTWVDVETEYSNLYEINTMSGSYKRLAGIYDNKICFVSSYSGNPKFAYYDFNDDSVNTYELPDTSDSDGTYCIVGDYLYRFGLYVTDSTNIQKYGYKYSLSDLSAEPIKLANNSIAFYDVLPIVDSANNYIYLFGVYGTYTSSSNDKRVYGGLYKYDINANTFSQILASSDYGGVCSGGVVIGDYIYVFGGMYRKSGYNAFKNTGARKININTGEITTLAAIPYVEDDADTGTSEGETNFVKAVAIGGDIYLSCSMSNKVLCYNTATDTYTEVCTTIPTLTNVHSYPVIYDNKIILNSQSVLNIGTKEFNEKDFIIQRTDWADGKYHTQFHRDISYGENFGRICSGFDNAWLYTNGDFDTTLPTYYGDGTKWVKFKN